MALCGREPNLRGGVVITCRSTVLARCVSHDRLERMVAMDPNLATTLVPMHITWAMRGAGAAAMVGGLGAIAMTPPFAVSFFLAYPGENSLPFWFATAEDRLGPLLSFASPVDVYEVYGRYYNLVYLLFVPMIFVLHHAQASRNIVLERRGFVVLTSGVALTAVGVAGDYWANGAGFPIEALGLLAMIVGVTMWGIAGVRSDVLPRLWSWTLLSCGPGALATSALVGHLPSGPTLSFALAWLIVGTLLLTHGDTAVTKYR